MIIDDGMNYVSFAASLLLCANLSCAQQPPTKTFHPPAYLPVEKPLVAKDEGCMKDLAKASRMEGVEQRKFLVDLFVYDCVQQLPSTYYLHITNVKQFGTGDAAVQARGVHLIDVIGGKATDGWMLADHVITADAIVKAMEAAEAQRAQKKN
jgi:hypothetical protein